jgi:hypothetical protein
MAYGSNFDEPLAEGLHLLEQNAERAQGARDDFEAVFQGVRPEGVSPQAWLARLHEFAAEGVWESRSSNDLEERAEKLVKEAREEQLDEPLDEDAEELGPEWSYDGYGTWMTHAAIDKVYEAGQIYKDIAGGWAGYASYWAELLEEFEEDPDAFVARVLGTDPPDGDG